MGLTMLLITEDMRVWIGQEWALCLANKRDDPFIGDPTKPGRRWTCQAGPGQPGPPRLAACAWTLTH